MKTLRRPLYQNSFWEVMKIVFLIMLFLGVYRVCGQEVTTKKVDPQTTSTQNQAQTQNNVETQNTAELGDIYPEELEVFDVSTIPESVPIPDANWVFEVPVDVKNIPPEIKKIGISVLVCKFMKDGKRVDFGQAQKRIDLINGAFSGSVIIGVEYSEDMVRGAKKKYTGEFFPPDAEKYECWMYLISPENSWKKPSLKQVIPSWRMASPNNPFRWKTNPQPLPENYASSTGTFDGGSVGAGNEGQTQGAPDGLAIPNSIAIPSDPNQSSTGVGKSNSEKEKN